MTTAVARLACDEPAARQLASYLAETLDPDECVCAAFEGDDGRWQVAAHFRAPPDEAALRALVGIAAGDDAAAALRIEPVEETDWVRQSLAGLKPVRAGRFVVHGAHDRASLKANDIGIEIEAALAFGTGHHGTTRGCLLALDDLAKRFLIPPPARGRVASAASRVGVRSCSLRRDPTPGASELGFTRVRHLRWSKSDKSDFDCRTLPFQGRDKRVLDIGTGSGVLAIAAAKILRHAVVASDIDRVAVEAARGNARLNRAGAMIRFARAAGTKARAIATQAPYDLIFANILLGPLQRLAVPIRALTSRHARVVLSGLLPSHANAALAAYRAQGLMLERRIQLEGWVTLVLRR